MGKQNPKHKKKPIQRKNSLSTLEKIRPKSFSELKPVLDEEFPRVDQIFKDFRDAFRFPTFPRENYTLPNFDLNSTKRIFQLKISIKYIRPPIWRRILIEDTATFKDLHDTIQELFDWENYHLHEFESRLKDPIETVIRIGCDDSEVHGMLNEENVELRQILSMENKRVHYLYDFGDNWEHLIVLEKIYAYSDFYELDYPICIKGKRVGPPEDCGGVYGYGNILDALKSPNDPDNEEILEWVGDFNPDEINCEIIPIKDIIDNEKKSIDKTSRKIPLNESSVQKDFKMGGISPKLLEIKDINSKSGKSITQIIDKFLETQEKRLKESTLKKYERNMESWKEVLNEDGKVILDDDLNISVNPLKFKDTRKKSFCNQYGENVLVPLIAIYLDHEYVYASNIDLEEFKEIATVFSKFIKWLNGEYIDNDQYVELNKQLTKFRNSIKIVENEGYNSENDDILAIFQKHFEQLEKENNNLFLNSEEDLLKEINYDAFFQDITSKDIKNWKKLIQKSLKFKKLACWRWMEEGQIFGIEDPKTDKIGFCSVMGILGEHKALGVYLGAKSLQGFKYFHLNNREYSPIDFLMNQRCLMVSFEHKRDLAHPDLYILELCGFLKNEMKMNLFPMFRDFKPPYIPWFLKRDQIQFLTLAVEQAILIGKRIQKEPNLLNRNNGTEYLIRKQVETEQGVIWEDSWIKYDIKPKKMEIHALDEINLSEKLKKKNLDKLKLQKLHRLDISKKGIWEIGDFVCFESIQDGDERPYYPFNMVCANKSINFILGGMVGDNQKILEDFANYVLELMERNNQIPETIHFATDKHIKFFRFLNVQFGIKLIKRKTLPTIKEFENSYPNFQDFLFSS